MKRTTIAIVPAMLIALFAGAVSAQPQTPPPAAVPAVQLVSLEIVKPLSKAQQELVWGQEGTRMKLLVSLPGAKLIGMDSDAAKLGKFVDDKGTDLSKTDSSGWGSANRWLGSWPRFSKDQSMCAVEISSTHAPAAGAARITLTGTLVFKTGADIKTVQQTAVSLAKGGKITVGPVPMTVKSTRDQQGKEKFIVAVEHKAPRDAIKTVQFLDNAGKEILSRIVGRSSMGIAGNMTYGMTFALERKVAAATVKITYYDKVATVTVPLKIDTGVGI